jgi:hypothetical protein
MEVHGSGIPGVPFNPLRRFIPFPGKQLEYILRSFYGRIYILFVIRLHFSGDKFDGPPDPFQRPIRQRAVGPAQQFREQRMPGPVTPHQGGPEAVIGITGFQPGLKNIQGILGLACAAEVIITFNIRIMIRQQIRMFQPEQFILDFRHIHGQ